ncbi:MAG TPA: 3'(2'),5'-bisphosphate nucleotidase CysQ [Rhizomicrobium sp.]|nr:3'(2'),5'-bisphosphate nucleotidase CysQ [Rhizomicrobium sp.]
MQGSDDLRLLESAVHAAGSIARNYYGGDVRRWSKAGGSPVTEADLAVDKFLKQTLCAARPDYGWLSEESADNLTRLERGRAFVVDPIDGTVAFLKQRPHFTICAAVVEAGRPNAGVVYNPITEEFFAGQAGGGASLNGAPIHVSDRDVIEGARMLAPKNLFADGAWPSMEVTTLSSIAYRLVLVAAGRQDAMISLTVKHDWDLAAADVIVQEAGGVLSDQAGRKLLYNRPTATQRATIAAGPKLHGLLLHHLRQMEGSESRA